MEGCQAGEAMVSWMDKSDKHMALLPAFNLIVKCLNFCIETLK